MRRTLLNGKWRKRLKIKALPPFAELHKVRAGNCKIVILIISTTNSIDGKTVSQYLGIVSGFATARFPGGSKLQRAWITAVENAQTEMVTQATGLGADAILGVKIDAYNSGVAGATDYLYITGTAVKLN